MVALVNKWLACLPRDQGFLGSMPTTNSFFRETGVLYLFCSQKELNGGKWAFHFKLHLTSFPSLLKRGTGFNYCDYWIIALYHTNLVPSQFGPSGWVVSHLYPIIELIFYKPNKKWDVTCGGLNKLSVEHWGGPRSTVNSILASRPAAPALILGVPKIFSEILDVVEIYWQRTA